MYLGDLCGAPHQVVDIVVELQLPLGCHLFNVCATEHHFVWEARDKERAVAFTTSQKLMLTLRQHLHRNMQRLQEISEVGNRVSEVWEY